MTTGGSGNRDDWFKRHEGHDISYNEVGTQSYTVKSIDGASVVVDANSTDGYVDDAYLFCEDCYNDVDARGPSPLEVTYE